MHLLHFKLKLTIKTALPFKIILTKNGIQIYILKKMVSKYIFLKKMVSKYIFLKNGNLMTRYIEKKDSVNNQEY